MQTGRGTVEQGRGKEGEGESAQPEGEGRALASGRLLLANGKRNDAGQGTAWQSIVGGHDGIQDIRVNRDCRSGRHDRSPPYVRASDREIIPHRTAACEILFCTNINSILASQRES